MEKKISIIILSLLLLTPIYATKVTKKVKLPAGTAITIRTINKLDSQKPKKRTVTVKKGDTWAKLAKKYTGSSKNAKKIKKANKMTNKKKPPVGKRIVIPV